MSKLHDLIHERLLLISLLLFALSSLVAFALEAETKKIIAVTIDIFGILVGAVSLALIFNMMNSFKGSLRKGFYYIFYGVAFQVLALLYTLIFVRLNVYSVPGGIDIHHFLMIVGIMLFTISAFKLRNMLSELK